MVVSDAKNQALLARRIRTHRRLEPEDARLGASHSEGVKTAGVVSSISCGTVCEKVDSRRRVGHERLAAALRWSSFALARRATKITANTATTIPVTHRSPMAYCVPAAPGFPSPLRGHRHHLRVAHSADRAQDATVTQGPEELNTWEAHK
jgi:hypothetical protein